MMQPHVIALVFAVIFIAELPDKSLFASLVLGTRYPAFYVWLGTAAAFFVHVIIAVTAGRLLTLLPHRVLEIIVAVLFMAGAGLIFFGRHGLEEAPKPHELENGDIRSGWKVFVTAFSVVIIGEWGDITQIATANYAAKYDDPLSVGIGAVLALWAVSALAVTAGNRVLSILPPKVLQRATGFILLGFGIWSAISAFR
jgi:putative Ca2+/H+ antiporter (TMEM165/GDT1 family)